VENKQIKHPNAAEKPTYIINNVGVVIMDTKLDASVS